MLPRYASCVLSRLRCKGQSLVLSSYLTRIGRIENPSCSACGHLSSHSALSSYRLFAPLVLWQLSVFMRPLVQTLGSCPDSGTPRSSAMPPSLRRVQIAPPPTTTLYPHREMDRNFLPSYSLIQTTYEEAEAIELSRFYFRFHRKKTASTSLVVFLYIKVFSKKR